MTAKKIAMVDLDNTLFRSAVKIVRVVNLRLKLKIRLKDVRSHFEGLGEDVGKVVRDICAEPKFYSDIKPYKCAQGALKSLKEKGYYVYLVTSRCEHLFNITAASLAHWELISLTDGLYLRPEWIGSAEFKLYLARFLKPDVIFDDDADVVKMLNKNGFEVNLIKQPWNRPLWKARRVKPVSSILAGVKKLPV